MNEKYDLFSFTYDRHDVLGYANLCHPRFTGIFDDLLNHLNIDSGIKPLIGLYQNAVIARSEIYRDYIENYLKPAVDFLEDSPQDYKEMLFSDAMYRE